VIYRRRPTPLHAARAAAACVYLGSLLLVALLFEHPLVLAADLVAVLGVIVLARATPALRTFGPLALSLALLIALVNPFVVREGLTVIARLGELGPLGRLDLTLEATVYGGVLGLRAAVLILAFVPYSAAVDPDGVLRLFRRFGFRSALSATLATRMVGVLARDARRRADAQRCRPRPAGRLAMTRAVTAGALDRAIDVAATLEVRGYGAAGRRPPGTRTPWSRHDLAYLAAGMLIAATAIAARAAGLAALRPYPTLELSTGPLVWALAGLIVVAAWLPFADRRGVAA